MYLLKNQSYRACGVVVFVAADVAAVTCIDLALYIAHQNIIKSIEVNTHAHAQRAHKHSTFFPFYCFDKFPCCTEQTA